MNRKEKIEYLKGLLRNGSVVVSAPKSGKTEALVEIYREDKDAAIVLPTEAGYKRFIDLYEHKYGNVPDKRYLMLGIRRYSGSYELGEVKGKKIYVDELYLNPYLGPFYSAVTSYPQPVVIVKDESEAI